MRCDFCYRPSITTLLGRPPGPLRRLLGLKRKRVHACGKCIGTAAEHLRGR